MCLIACHHRVLATARLPLATLCQKSFSALHNHAELLSKGAGSRELSASLKFRPVLSTANACCAESIDVFAGGSDQPALQPQGHMSPAPPAPRLPKPSYSAAPVINKSVLAQASSCLRSSGSNLQPPLSPSKAVFALLFTLYLGCASCNASPSPWMVWGCRLLLATSVFATVCIIRSSQQGLAG